MSNPLRIGTRESRLAVWQARHVASLLDKHGIVSELIYIKSEGDQDRTTPLAEMGGKGVFTKALDDALLEDKIDLAVHSFKDLPTENPLPLKVAAVLEREDPRDVLVAPKGTHFLDEDNNEAVIATGSPRRKAQWLNRYPKHRVVGLRGNVPTRIDKVTSEGWQGAIFAAAGLIRLGLEEEISLRLDWMVPAPAQGAVAVMVREEDRKLQERIGPLGDEETTACTGAERRLLNRMEAGCSAPVGAYARMDGAEIELHAVALSLDGSVRIETRRRGSAGQAKSLESLAEELGRQAADELLDRGAGELVGSESER